MANPDVLLDGLYFPEGPRWHDNRLWFSDMHGHRVIALGLDGKAETVVEVPAAPSGLGWLPDGRLLVVSMEDRRLLRLGSPASTLLGDDRVAALRQGRACRRPADRRGCRGGVRLMCGLFFACVQENDGSRTSLLATARSRRTRDDHVARNGQEPLRDRASMRFL